LQFSRRDVALLDTLRPVTARAWITLPTCTPNTRVSVLDDIEARVRSSSDLCVFWLNGLAGTGKSTIAATVCERLDEQHLLGASFFVSRQQADTRDAQGIVRSIAHELASRNRLISEALCATLRDNSASVSRSLDKQIADFVTKPARVLDAQSMLVIVIDALDECFLDVNGRPGGELVLVFVRQLLSLSGRLKLFITSRNEVPIQQMFVKLAETAQQRVTKLHDLDKAIVQTDIQTYFKQSFHTLREYRSMELSLTDWPDHNDLQCLVDQSGLLFIYAATVVRYLSSPHHSPPERLAQVLGRQRASGITSPHHHLDELYMGILQDAVNTSGGERDSDLYDRLHAVVAVIVLAQSPVHVDALAILSGVKLTNVRIVIRYLTSLLLVTTDDEPVRIFHPSFPDFMTDARRCTMESLRVNPPIDHGVLASRCLSILNETLHYDMCDIQNPATGNRNVPDLAGRLRKKVISWNAVRYACCFWTRHLVEHEKPSSDLLDILDDFCRKHLFHWLEILSLIEHLSSLEGELLQVIEWCKVQGSLSMAVIQAHYRIFLIDACR
jgi:cytidylate kinase